MMEFTSEEIKALKEIAQDKIKWDSIFKYDKDGNKIPQGNYSDMVRIMKGKESE